MSFWTKVVSVAISCMLVIYIVRTIRTRKIMEEYVILWLVTAVCTAVLVIFDNFSVWLAKLIGAQNDVVMVTFLAFVYILALLVHYSLRISGLIYNTKDLNQEIALLRRELEELKGPIEKK